MKTAELTNAEIGVIQERRRQIEIKGFDAEQDDTYVNSELQYAAMAYAFNRPELWPWPASTFKPTEKKRALEKAAALLIAEIERITRYPKMVEDNG